MSTTDGNPNGETETPDVDPRPDSFSGQPAALIERVVDLLDPQGNVLLGTSYSQACQAVQRGDIEAVGRIRGQFAI